MPREVRVAQRLTSAFRELKDSLPPPVLASLLLCLERLAVDPSPLQLAPPTRARLFEFTSDHNGRNYTIGLAFDLKPTELVLVAFHRGS